MTLAEVEKPSQPSLLEEIAQTNAKTWSVPLIVEGKPIGGASQPVSIGVPFPKGALKAAKTLALFDADGRSAPLQTSVLNCWSDGSIKWLLVDFIITKGNAGGNLSLRFDDSHGAAEERPTLRVLESADGLTIDTGTTTFNLNRTSFPPLSQVSIGTAPVLEPESAAAVLTDCRGRQRLPRIDRFVVETRGPVRVTIRMEGGFEGASPCRFVARCCFFAGTGLMRLRLTLHNPNAATHRGGLWDLGAGGSIFFQSLAMKMSLRDCELPTVIWTSEPGDPPRSCDEPVEIYQDSSGGENWQSRNHVNAQGIVPCKFRGYRVRAAGTETFGRRAAPWISIRSASASLTAAVPEFWQQFPKALEAVGPCLRIGLFPEQWSDRFELQGGEQKTHTVWLNFGDARAPASALSWVHDPIIARPAAAWCEAAGILPWIGTTENAPDDDVERLVRSAVHGDRSLAARREIIDEFGWRNFGDVFADHESAHYSGPPPVISHYNNQYDLIYGAALNYLRSADAEWFRFLDPLARHVMDIDIYHTTHDRAAYSGGPFWHTEHYLDAATGTHRGFSKANANGRMTGGGPCNEHNYTTGLLHYHFLTGDPQARETVLGLADWVLRCDDGSQTIPGIVDSGPTGLASRTREPGYHGPGRGCGNSINALLDAWLLSRRPHYLQNAEALIRRSIHPNDDIDAHELLDAERRWSYTVFLSVLARYLEIKAEMGERDGMYAYARTSLVKYGQWMLANEIPYLDRPDRLQYPNETWAAQDFRKANILRLAGNYTEPPLRRQMLRRANEIADQAWGHLQRFPAHNSARVLALLLVEGPRDRYFRAGHTTAASESSVPSEDIHIFPPPQRFRSQRQRVIEQLTHPRGMATAAFRAMNPRRWRRYLSSGKRWRNEQRIARSGPVVCQVLHDLQVGGAQILAARLARQLRGSYSFVFICLDEIGALGEELREQGFAVHQVSRRPGVDWGCPRRITRILRDERVDLLHCHLYTPFFYGIAARLGFRGPAVLFTEHGRPFPDHPRFKRKAANRLLLERRDRVVGVGAAVRRALDVNEGISADRVGIVYNGIDLSRHADNQDCRRSIRKEIGVDQEDFVVVQVARLDPVKDHATALRTIAQVALRRTDVRLVIVGEGPELPVIKRHIAELGIAKHVRPLGLRSDIPRLLSAADVFLLTSVTEGIPLSVIEAMAAGLPVVATNVGGVGEVVEDGVTGFLSPAADPVELAANLLRLGNDPALSENLGNAGRLRAQALFSEERMFAEYRKIYEEMLVG
jgi:glycosyltransferase involved in cell wall biosynthesis